MVFLYLISKGCENMEKSLEQWKQEYEKTTVLLEREKRKMQRLKKMCIRDRFGEEICSVS